MTPQEQLQAQREAVARIESSPCKCFPIYHPVGEEWERIRKEWRSSHSASAYHLAQLFGECPGRSKEVTV